MEHADHAAAAQQLWRQAAGGLPRSIPVWSGRLSGRLCDANLARKNHDRPRRGVTDSGIGVYSLMATTVHEPPKNEERRDPLRPTGNSGNGGGRNLVPADGKLPAVKDYSPPPASTGIWVVLAAITMSFAAFTSALVVRKGGSLDWRPFTLPVILYANTLVLLASSVTLEISRRRVAVFMGGIRSRAANPARWLYFTLSLGLLFLAGL